MDILTNNQTITTEYAVIIEGINAKWKAQREKLKRTIAETARSQAAEILDNDNFETMGDPETLCRKMAELRLEYNSVVIKQKEYDNKNNNQK